MIRLASRVFMASSSQPGLTRKMSARDGKAGRGEFCIAHPHAAATDNTGEHSERGPTLSGQVRKCGTKCGSVETVVCGYAAKSEGRSLALLM